MDPKVDVRGRECLGGEGCSFWAFFQLNILSECRVD
jgi:hypothetical protein